ncbi:hypothetical protein ACLKA7_007818 [Drosophila subpalustris]
MRDAEARILGVLNDKLSGITGELDQMAQRLQQLERDVGDVRALKEHVASLEAKLSAKIENDANANVVRIHGIPQHEGENLKTFYHSLCFSLHLTPPPRIREIYRVRQRVQTHSVMDPIVFAKFNSPRDKKELLSAAGAHHELRSNH